MTVRRIQRSKFPPRGRIVKESSNVRYLVVENSGGDIRTDLQELVDSGKLSWEELAGGLCDYLKDEELRSIAASNGWLEVDEKSSFGDDDEDDYIVEPDGNGGFTKRPKSFEDDWEDIKAAAKNKLNKWFGRR